MKYLADENIPAVTVHTLQRRGFDVVWVGETSAGAADHEVLDQARRSARVLITFDKDFAELVFRDKSERPIGIILLRTRAKSPDVVTQTVLTLLESDRAWEGHFSVVSDLKIRMVKM